MRARCPPRALSTVKDVLHTLAIESYRSLRRIVLPLTSLNVVTGGNGTGKSSLYRSLRLLADGARNGMVGALAREGGLPSVLWAGPAQPSRAARAGRYPLQGTASSRTPVALRLGFGEDDFGYAIDLGLPRRRTRPSPWILRSSGKASGAARCCGHRLYSATGSAASSG